MELYKGITKHPEIDTILVIGANGNMGQALIPELLRLGYKVRALQNKSEVPEREGQEIVKGNTLDSDAMQKAMEGVDAVCNLIRATTKGSPGEDDRQRWFNCCLAGTSLLLDIAKDAGLKRFINGSADNVFGITTSPLDGITEKSEKRTEGTFYSLYKILEDELCHQYFVHWNVPVVITRFPLIWKDSKIEGGAGQVKDGTITRTLDKEGNPLKRHDVHIADAVQGVLLALEKDEAIGQDFTFPGPKAHTTGEAAEILKKKTGLPIKDSQVEWYSWSIDYTKAKEVLGYKPQIDLMERMKELYQLEAK